MILFLIACNKRPAGAPSIPVGLCSLEGLQVKRITVIDFDDNSRPFSPPTTNLVGGKQTGYIYVDEEEEAKGKKDIAL